ncbi:MAG: ABC transporter permease [Lachnospiraceae bacterium]|nr:ABC transporter permease [Lachnospiraceae bacterium]
MKHIKEIFMYTDMIKSLVKRDLRGKYKGSVLGFLWTFINPLCQIIVYIIVFSMIVKTNLENFYAYIIVGMMPWFFFDMSLRQGSGCVRYQGEMIKKIYFPREVLPLACVTSNFINMLFCYIIVFAILIISGIGLSFKALFFLPMVMMVEYVLVLGFTLIVSAGTVYFKDLEHIVTVILMAWIYLTPILFSMDVIPEKMVWIFKCNPMTPIIEAYHNILYWKCMPKGRELLYSMVWAMVILIVGELTFAKLNDNFAEEL